MKVHILERLEDGSDRRAATFTYQDGEVVCDNIVLWKHLMNSGGGVIVGYRGKKFYPRDGLEYLKNLKYQFAGPYLFAELVEDEPESELPRAPEGVIGAAITGRRAQETVERDPDETRDYPPPSVDNKGRDTSPPKFLPEDKRSGDAGNEDADGDYPWERDAKHFGDRSSRSAWSEWEDSIRSPSHPRESSSHPGGPSDGYSRSSGGPGKDVRADAAGPPRKTDSGPPFSSNSGRRGSGGAKNDLDDGMPLWGSEATNQQKRMSEKQLSWLDNGPTAAANDSPKARRKLFDAFSKAKWREREGKSGRTSKERAAEQKAGPAGSRQEGRAKGAGRQPDEDWRGRDKERGRAQNEGKEPPGPGKARADRRSRAANAGGRSFASSSSPRAGAERGAGARKTAGGSQKEWGAPEAPPEETGLRRADGSLTSRGQEKICAGVFRLIGAMRGIAYSAAQREANELLGLLAELVEIDLPALKRSLEANEEYLELKFQPPTKVNYGKTNEKLSRYLQRFVEVLEAGELAESLQPLYLFREGLSSLPNHRTQWQQDSGFHSTRGHRSAGLSPEDAAMAWDRAGLEFFLRKGFSQEIFRGTYEKAVPLFRQSVEYFQQADFGRAEMAMREALIFDPGHSETRLLLGDLLRRLDRVPEALAELQHAVELEYLGLRSPEGLLERRTSFLLMARAQVCIGRTLLGLGSVREATEQLEFGLENLDRLTRRNPPENLEEELRLQLKEEFGNIHRLLEPLYRALGETERAEHHHKRVPSSASGTPHAF